MHHPDPKRPLSKTARSFPSVLIAAAMLALSAPALAQQPAPGSGSIVTPDPEGKGGTVSPAPLSERQVGRDMSKADYIDLNFPVDSSLMDWVKFFADFKRLNFIIPDIKEIENKKVTIISYARVKPDAAWEAFLSALQVNGYALSVTGQTAKIVKLGQSSRVGTGVPRDSDEYVTQLITLENTRVDDMSKIISNMAGPESKIVSYPPTNTLIISDTAANIRKIYKVLQELDVASPKSTMEIYALQYAAAADVKTILEQLYKVDEAADTSSSRNSSSSRTSSRSSSRRSGTSASRRPEPASEAVSAGDETKFIAQVIDDDRTNSLIVLANEDGHQAVRDLITKLDVDISQEGEIHVLYLEHAKADEVANVLSQLSQGGASASSQQANRRASARTPAPNSRTTPARAGSAAGDGGDSDEGGAMAAFDSGMRIAADESTNSLVIIADREDFIVVKKVIDQLDIERKQVFVDAVIMELSSEDAFNLGIAAHLPQQPNQEAAGFIGAQLGASSLGLTTDALSGLAVGVFGKPIPVPILDPLTQTAGTLEVPAFGIALNAIKSSGSTNIISNPSLMTLDNEEASVVVGRKVPFPTTSGLNNLGQPVLSFQREDVAITLKVTPRINSSNFVTLELEVEVQEVEDSAQSATVSAAGGGFITSQRKLETVALVADNQTMVIGGLVGTTDSNSESKVPVLGDIPVFGALFRSQKDVERKTNLMVFLTPHIVDEPDDMMEIQRIKEAQRQEFLRRFYGKSRTEFYTELKDLLRYSMNFVDEPTMYRGPSTIGRDMRLDEATRQAFRDAVEESRNAELGKGAGTLPEEDDIDIDDGAPAPQPE